MKINIYYGGRGLLDDPTLYVLKKMQNVFTELRVTVERYNIFEYKNYRPANCLHRIFFHAFSFNSL